MAKKEAITLKGQDEDMTFFIENGMKRYEKVKNDVKIIDPSWTF